ncbi:MAG: ABC transporter substrate-binding protein [Synergistaceae bacterium]|jgi:peptide/nickel transport system substrate-binding protein|nr:ABC transporter substrate-binding protein [Synergistaceae bacterium]
MKKSVLILLVLAFITAFSGIGFAAKDTLIVADQYDPTTMDPITQNDMPSHRAVLEIYDTLYFITEGGDVVPGLAESWEFLSDTAYKFNLRKGVKFHNGDEMKASDVKFTFDRAVSDVGAMIKTFSQNVKDVDIVDDYTVIVNLKDADYSFFASLTHNWAAIVSQRAVTEAGDTYGMNPVGTGPFKFVSWQKGDRYTLERFDDFWGEKAKVKTVVVRSVPEPTSRTIELESGGADVAYPITHNDLKRIDDNPDLTLLRKPQTSTTYMGFNMSKKPFDDVRVRRAISMALDTVGIQAASWRGVGKVPTSLVPGDIRYSIESELPVHTQDVEAAKKLLAEAGIKDLKLELWTNERSERVNMATIIQAQLEEVGVACEIKVLEWGAFLSGMTEKTHDMYILGWVNGISDPNFSIAGLLESSSANNYTFTRDEKIDGLLAKGRSIPDGPDKAALYKELQLYINDIVPMVYLHNDESIAGTQKNVRDFLIRSNEYHSFRLAFFQD